MIKLLSLVALIATLALTGCDRSRPNTLPTANAGPHQAVNENTPVSLSGSGADAEDTVQYSWTQTSGTTVMLSGADTENASFTAPEVNEDEDLVFQLTVTDADGASATDTVTVTVANVPNVPPMADAGSDLTVDQTMPVSLSGSGTDAEGAVQYSWTQTSGTTVMLSGADTENASFTAPEVDEDEDLVFQLTVTDADGASATDTVTVTILWSEVTYTITTVAGSDSASGDGGPAREAQLTAPYGVTTDSEGNIYIPDTENHRIRKVDTEGIITTFAGTGEEGYGGDGGPATEAKLDWPTGVAADDDGNVYIADRNNERVRKVDSEGIITTFAGTGEWGYDSDEDGGPAAEALLNWPTGLALDADGNFLYIADEYNNRIRQVDIASGIINTVAGMRRLRVEQGEEEEENPAVGDDGPATNALLHRPTGVAVDGEGNLYIADRLHHRVRKVDTEGMITTIAGMADEGFSGDGGPATSAQLDQPSGVAVDGDGYIFIADRGNNRIRQISPDGVITTILGTGDGGDESDGEAPLAAPRGLAVGLDGDVYVADTGNHQIALIDDAGVVSRVAGIEGLSDGGSATQARLLEPTGVAIDADGNLYITDTGNRRVRKVDTNGIITTFAGSGQKGHEGDGGPALEAAFDCPGGIAIDAEGNVYVADQCNNRVRKVDASGIITTFAGTGVQGPAVYQTPLGDDGPATSARLVWPTALDFDSEGNLYITDPGNHRVRKVDTSGTITSVAGTGERSFSGDDGPAAEAQLSTPFGIAIEADGTIYIADFVYPRNRVRKIDTAGIITTIAEVASSGGLAVDVEGNVYIVQATVGRILKLSPAGVLNPIAGSTKPGFSGDGGPATLAQLDTPKGIDIDDDGNLYVADTENNRIRKLTPNR